MALVRLLLLAFICIGLARAHLAAWHPGMYCINGVAGGINLNSQDIVTPLWMLTKNDWWFHHVNGCDNFPPPDGQFLELPAGKDFTVEIAANRAKTTLSYNGRDISDWPDGQTHPDNFNIPTCITQPNMHTQNQSMAAGTAFAISYESDIKKVTPDNLVVFTVRYHTPWKRVTSYSVPAAMPACPPGGCICAWGWVPNGCGEPNMYHQPFKCQVTGATSTTPLATPKPPVWCEDDPSKCVKGAKQMIYWNQQDGNNIAVDGYDLSGSHKSPAYNAKCGFPDGAQNDIFSGSSTSSNPKPPPSNPAPAATSSSSVVAPPSSSSSSASSAPSHYNASAASPSPSPTSTTSSSALPDSTPAPVVIATLAPAPAPSPSPAACRHRQKHRLHSKPPSHKKKLHIHHRQERRSW